MHTSLPELTMQLSRACWATKPFPCLLNTYFLCVLSACLLVFCGVLVLRTHWTSGIRVLTARWQCALTTVSKGTTIANEEP